MTKLNQIEIDRVIEMAWEDRTPFEAIKFQFGLTEKNVIGDWREPNVIRMAPTPLYNSFEDVYEFVERLKEAITENNI